MTLATDSTSLYAKLERLATPLKDPDDPIYFNFFINQIKKIHGGLESRLYSCLNPKTAELGTNLLYAIPAGLAINALSTKHTVVLSLIGGIYVWRCKEDLMAIESKINILHSIALGFFSTLFHHAKKSENGFLRFSTHAAFMTASLLASSRLEKKAKNTPARTS